MSTFIYLHGFASGPSSHKAQVFRRKFAERGLELQVPDLARGDFENLTITGQLAVVAGAAAGRPAVLIGSSLGGYLAALYASRHPETERVVLMAPAFCFARRWRESLGPERIEEWQSRQKIPVYHYGDRATKDLGYQLMDDAAAYEDFPDFQQPGLILHGTHDDVVPADLSSEFALRHPNVRLKLLDSGHTLTDVLDTLWTQMAGFLLLQA